jgi:hypothetical protein
MSNLARDSSIRASFSLWDVILGYKHLDLKGLELLSRISRRILQIEKQGVVSKDECAVHIES